MALRSVLIHGSPLLALVKAGIKLSRLQADGGRSRFQIVRFQTALLFVRAMSGVVDERTGSLVVISQNPGPSHLERAVGSRSPAWAEARSGRKS